MRDFTDTMPVIPHRFDAESVRRFREHEADDAAAADDDRPGQGGGALIWPLIVALLAVDAFALKLLLPGAGK